MPYPQSKTQVYVRVRIEVDDDEPDMCGRGCPYPRVIPGKDFDHCSLFDHYLSSAGGKRYRCEQCMKGEI